MVRFFTVFMSLIAGGMLACPTIAQDAPRKGTMLVYDASSENKFVEYRNFQKNYSCTRGSLDDELCVRVGEAAKCDRTGFLFLLSSKNNCVPWKRDSRKKGFPKCKFARDLWKSQHPDTGDPANRDIPAIYGQIVRYDLSPKIPGSDNWTGIVETCTFIGDDEYFFQFKVDGKLVKYSNDDPENPFPDTLDLKGKKMLLDMINQKGWRYKIHAKGKTGFKLQLMRKNNARIRRSLFNSDFEKECFDMFFKEIPQPRRLPDAYCMGRCNAKIVNTM